MQVTFKYQVCGKSEQHTLSLDPMVETMESMIKMFETQLKLKFFAPPRWLPAPKDTRKGTRVPKDTRKRKVLDDVPLQHLQFGSKRKKKDEPLVISLIGTVGVVDTTGVTGPVNPVNEFLHLEEKIQLECEHEKNFKPSNYENDAGLRWELQKMNPLEQDLHKAIVNGNAVELEETFRHNKTKIVGSVFPGLFTRAASQGDLPCWQVLVRYLETLTDDVKASIKAKQEHTVSPQLSAKENGFQMLPWMWIPFIDCISWALHKGHTAFLGNILDAHHDEIGYSLINGNRRMQDVLESLLQARNHPMLQYFFGLIKRYFRLPHSLKKDDGKDDRRFLHLDFIYPKKLILEHRLVLCAKFFKKEGIPLFVHDFALDAIKSHPEFEPWWSLWLEEQPSSLSANSPIIQEAFKVAFEKRHTEMLHLFKFRFPQLSYEFPSLVYKVKSKKEFLKSLVDQRDWSFLLCASSLLGCEKIRDLFTDTELEAVGESLLKLEDKAHIPIAHSLHLLDKDAIRKSFEAWEGGARYNFYQALTEWECDWKRYLAFTNELDLYLHKDVWDIVGGYAHEVDAPEDQRWPLVLDRSRGEEMVILYRTLTSGFEEKEREHTDDVKKAITHMWGTYRDCVATNRGKELDMSLTVNLLESFKKDIEKDYAKKKFPE
jgi:hypothetical protein